MKQEDKLCDDVETYLDITYLDDRVSVDGGCEAAVTARTRCGCFMYGRRFPLWLKGAVYESYVMPTTLYGN